MPEQPFPTYGVTVKTSQDPKPPAPKVPETAKPNLPVKPLEQGNPIGRTLLAAGTFLNTKDEYHAMLYVIGAFTAFMIGTAFTTVGILLAATIFGAITAG